MDIAGKMQRDWERRAREHARFFIATEDYTDDARFAASGEATARSLLGRLGDTRHWDALEIGCGIGRVLRPLAPHFRSLCGIDVSREMIAQSRDWLAGAPNVRTLAGSGIDLAGLADHSFDLVYAYVAFQHMPREVFDAYLREANRVLRPGGQLLFQTYVGDPWDPGFDDTISLRIYAPEELRRRLEEAGFAPPEDLDAPSGRPISRWVLTRRQGAPRPEGDGSWRARQCGDRPSPTDAHLQLCLAQELYDSGDLAGARDTYARLVAYDPDQLPAWLTLVSIQLELGDRRAALAELELIRRSHPDCAPARDALERLRRAPR